MKMKKFLAILLLTTCLLLALTACGGDKTPAGDNPGNSDTPVTTDEPKQDDTKAPQIDADTPITEEMLRSYPETPASEFEYDEWPDSVTINKYIGASPVVVIPREINGKPVTELPGYMFSNDSTVRAVRYPDTIEEVAAAFANNDNVEIVIFEGTKRIEEMTFFGCSSLHTVIIDKDLEELSPNGTFVGCSNLSKLYIPASLSNIEAPSGDYIAENDAGEKIVNIFYGCDDLVIYGEAGSYIETYAKEQGIPFQAE